MPVSSQSAPPSAPVFDVDGFSWVTDETVGDMLGRAVSVTEGVAVLGVHSLGDGSRIRISQAADDEIVSWRERRVHACESFSRSERGSDARGHRSVTRTVEMWILIVGLDAGGKTTILCKLKLGEVVSRRT